MSGSIFAGDDDFPSHNIPTVAPIVSDEETEKDEDAVEIEKSRNFHQQQEQYHQQQYQQYQPAHQQQQHHHHIPPTDTPVIPQNLSVFFTPATDGHNLPMEDGRDHESDRALDSIKINEKRGLRPSGIYHHPQAPGNEKVLASHQAGTDQESLIDMSEQQRPEVAVEKAQIELSIMFKKMTKFKETLDLIIDSLRKISERRHPGVQGISESIQMSNARFYEVFLNGTSDPSAETAMNYACTILDILHNNINIVERLIMAQNAQLYHQHHQQQLREKEELDNLHHQIYQESLTTQSPIQTLSSIVHQQQPPKPQNALTMPYKKEVADEARANSVISTIKPPHSKDQKEMEKKKVQSVKTVVALVQQQQQQQPTKLGKTHDQHNLIPTMKMSELAEMQRRGGSDNKGGFYRLNGSESIIPGDNKYPRQDDPPTQGQCFIA
jgi:hypothetical protein